MIWSAVFCVAWACISGACFYVGKPILGVCDGGVAFLYGVLAVARWRFDVRR